MLNPTPSLPPEAQQLLRLVQGALHDGCRDEAAPLSLVKLEEIYAATRIILEHPGRPEQAVLCGYLYGRLWSDPEIKGQQPPGLKPAPENLKATALKWIRERRQPRPEPPPLPAPDWHDPKFLWKLTRQALSAGWQDENADTEFPESIAEDIANLLLRAHPRDPHWAIILGYCSSRANAIAYKMERAPTAEPDRWFNQAMLNWLQDQTAE